MELLVDFAPTAIADGKTHVAYVDTTADGELLKETFDVEAVPSIYLVHGEKFYQLAWSKKKGLWNKDYLQKFVAEFDQGAYTWDFLRSRVTDGIPLYVEYAVNTLV